MSWHVDREVLSRYQAGTVDRVAAASLEAHVTECQQCRAALDVDSDWLERSWSAIADRVEPSATTGIERILIWVGVPAHLARVITVTPSLRPSWLIAVSLSLAFAGFASLLVQPGSFDLFLALAPLVPVAGVAVAYGRLADPAHEMSATTPIDPLRLLLLRVAAVTGFTFVLTLMVDLIFAASRVTGLWILPSLSLTLVTLALGTRLTMWVAAGISAGAWVTLLVGFLVRPDGNAGPLFEFGAQLGFMGVAVLAAIVFAREMDVYRRGEHR